MFYFYHFQTLSGKISAFWHILYGKSVKRALYVSNGKKRFCLEKVTFFHHLPILSWNFSGFCRRFFCEVLKSAFFKAKINNLRKSKCCHKHFLIIVTHLAKKLQPFWGLRNLLRLTAKSALNVSNGFFEHLKEKKFSEKKSFLRHLWTSSEKNSAFAEHFPAWVPNLQSSSLKKQIE